MSKEMRWSKYNGKLEVLKCTMIREIEILKCCRSVSTFLTQIFKNKDFSLTTPEQNDNFKRKRKHIGNAYQVVLL